jgi:hypothetical protein
MRELKRIIIGKNFDGKLWELLAINKTTFWERSEEDLEGGYMLVPNKFQFINYRNLDLVPMVEDIVKGNVNGRASAEMLHQLFLRGERTNDKAKIEWWLKTITLGQVTSRPGGFCSYNEEYRLLVLNESRENWQSNFNGERDRMFIIGDCCEQQGIAYRYLPKAAADESTILILALPHPRNVIVEFKLQEGIPKPTMEQTIQSVVNKVVDDSVLPEQVAVKPKEIIAPTVRRGILRKGRPEVDIRNLEEIETE